MTWTVKWYFCWILNSFRSVNSLYWIKFVKYTKLFKIQDTDCYNINFIFILSPKDVLLEFFKFEFRHVSSSSYICRKDCKVLGKNAVAFWQNFGYMVKSFVFHYMWQLWLKAHKNYSKFCTAKCKKQHYVYCNYNDISIIYITSSMALLRVRNH